MSAEHACCGTLMVLPEGNEGQFQVLRFHGNRCQIQTSDRIPIDAAIQIEIGHMVYLAEVISCTGSPPDCVVVAEIEQTLDMNKVAGLWGLKDRRGKALTMSSGR